MTKAELEKQDIIDLYLARQATIHEIQLQILEGSYPWTGYTPGEYVPIEELEIKGWDKHEPPPAGLTVGDVYHHIAPRLKQRDVLAEAKVMATLLALKKETLEKSLLAVKSGEDCFIDHADYFTIQFDRWMIPTLKKSPGAKYLAHLFSKKGNEFSYTELAMLFPRTVKKSNHDKTDAPRKEPESKDTLSPEQREKFEEERIGLERDVECARKRKDAKGLRDAKKTLSDVNAYLLKHYGTRTRPKSYYYEGDTMRSAVSKAINRAFKEIGAKSKPLGQYMKAHFTTINGKWAYRP